jgi:hypothetical protein
MLRIFVCHKKLGRYGTPGDIANAVALLANAKPSLKREDRWRTLSWPDNYRLPANRPHRRTRSDVRKVDVRERHSETIRQCRLGHAAKGPRAGTRGKTRLKRE